MVKEYNSLSYLWNFESDIPNSFGEILFQKLESLQRIYRKSSFKHPSQISPLSL